MFLEKRSDSLANQGWRHVDKTRLVFLFLLGAPSITVELLESWKVEVTGFYFTVFGVRWTRGEMQAGVSLVLVKGLIVVVVIDFGSAIGAQGSVIALRGTSRDGRRRSSWMIHGMREGGLDRKGRVSQWL